MEGASQVEYAREGCQEEGTAAIERGAAEKVHETAKGVTEIS